MTAWTAWLYGSVAREDYDPATSDLDVLLISDLDETPAILRGLVAPLPRSEHLSLVRYDWDEIYAMASYGSLFLWHMKMQGRPLAENPGSLRFRRLLDRLPSYRGSMRDVAGFKTALEDSASSLHDGGDPCFELGVIATVLRHASILACFQRGTPAYDLKQSLGAAFEAYDIQPFLDEALELYYFRLSFARKLPPPTLAPSFDLAWKWITIAVYFIERLEMDVWTASKDSRSA
jgi:Nucleotidyltransferase domain